MTTAQGAATLVTLDDYELAARKIIPPATWEYIDGGAADEHTLRWNRESFARVRLSPRVLNDVHRLDTKVRILETELAHPILLAPVAANGLVHADGEVAAARGARAAGAGMVLSSYTSKRVEDVAAAAPSPFWFQLYLQERTATRALIDRVVAAGCSALCLTVDTPAMGARDRMARSGFEFPADLPYKTVEPGDNPCTWRDVEWIQTAAKVPVLLKGILHPDDAERAIDAGAAGLVVSNHGARNLDTLPATIDALAPVSDRVRGRVPVLFDGGIRRGTDVVKALAFGASAVLVGRPYVHGLAVAGADGVRAVIDILRRELELAMALLGRPTIRDIDRSVIWA
jgi:4-hydroxymandelate oxidase